MTLCAFTLWKMVLMTDQFQHKEEIRLAKLAECTFAGFPKFEMHARKNSALNRPRTFINLSIVVYSEIPNIA